MELAFDTHDHGEKTAAMDRDAEFRSAVDDLKSLCQDDMTRVDAAILENLASKVSIIPELAGHLIKAGGKRLRPILTLSAARLLGYEGDDHIRLAAAVELIHGATLLHDDVVDGSKMRRGLSTANVIWGNKESVLVGDFIFSRAFELMVATGELRVLQILSRASGIIAEGEVLQLATQKNLDATFDMYLSVVEAKTAALFAAAARSGAVVARAAPDVENALYDYGRYLGIAFQLVDDALDYSGRQAALGKTVGDDFREGKMTLPVVYALERASSEDRAFWRRTITEGNQSSEDFDRAREIIEACGARDDTVAMAEKYAARAVDCLSAAPQNNMTKALSALALSSVQRAS